MKAESAVPGPPPPRILRGGDANNGSGQLFGSVGAVGRLLGSSVGGEPGGGGAGGTNGGLGRGVTTGAAGLPSSASSYTVPANAFKGKPLHVLDVPLPPGCTAEAAVPGEDDAFGVLYLNQDRVLGAVIWDGFSSQDLGVYDTDRDAHNACRAALRIVLQYKNQNALLLQSLAESMLPSAVGGGGPGASHTGASTAAAAAAAVAVGERARAPYQLPQSLEVGPPASGLGGLPAGMPRILTPHGRAGGGGGGGSAGLDTKPLNLSLMAPGLPSSSSLTGHGTGAGGMLGGMTGALGAAAAAAAALQSRGGAGGAATPAGTGSAGAGAAAPGSEQYAELFSFLQSYPKGGPAATGSGAAQQAASLEAQLGAVTAAQAGRVLVGGQLLPGNMSLQLASLAGEGAGAGPGGVGVDVASGAKRSALEVPEGVPGSKRAGSDFDSMRTLAALSVQDMMRQLAEKNRQDQGG